MAQLNSPGVSVTVIDESFYTPAAPGTVPLIIVASAESKPNASSTGTAPGTLKVNTGQVYLLTSQKDLVDTFGTPVFYTDANNNPIHAGEMNEYGLQAAYSYLGVSNRAYVVRADLDLSQLSATSTEPSGNPNDGAYWFDTTDTNYGIFEWNSATAIAGGQVFTNVVPTVITDIDHVNEGTGAPLSSIGKVGNYAVVAITTDITVWYKKGATDGELASGTWVQVGTSEWRASRPFAQGITNPTLPEGTGDKLNFTIDGVLTEVSVDGFNSPSELVTYLNTAGLGSTPYISGITAGLNSVTGYFELYSSQTLDVTLAGTAFNPLFGLKNADGTNRTSGIFKPPALAMAPHYSVPSFKRADFPLTYNGIPTGSIWVKTTNPNLGAEWIVKRYNATTELWQTKPAPLYANNAEALKGLDLSGGGLNLALGTVYVKYNYSEATPELADFKIYARTASGPTVITSAAITASMFDDNVSYSFDILESRAGSSDFYPLNSGDGIPVSFTGNSTIEGSEIDKIIDAITSQLEDTNLTVAKAPTGNQIIITHTQGGDIKFKDGSGTPISKLFGSSTNVYLDPAHVSGFYVASLWTATVKNSLGEDVAFVTASANPLTTDAEDGVLWYDSNIEDVDILINDGTNWVGYLNYDQSTGVGGPSTHAYGPFVMASEPTGADRQDGEPELGHGDLWIDTSDLENYPNIYRYDYNLKKWILLDNTDQTTENGVLFHDARWSVNGADTAPATIAELLTSDYLDPDAPNPVLYPRGMLLWNLRRSGFNVKKYVKNYINVLERNPRHQAAGEDELMTNYNPNRWLSWAANQPNGAGSFGRLAQRGVVVQALQALINSNQDIRDDEGRIFNLIACPGYSELISEMIALNVDRGLTAFVVGDCPARLTPDATSLSNWGNNVNNVLEDNDKGLVSYDEYMAVYYPWGYSSDNLGNNIAVPPSHMMLRTIALSDNVSYPWFAPAGTRRGGITNASAVGYITSEGEFQSASLNTGQRDTLAAVSVNPITFINGAGIVCYGQKTRARNASALDRINVARLVVYLRRQFTQLAKPYIFEPNDKITRDEIKGAAESLLLELVGQRALYDYIVVCDTSNNTPARIDRNELYLDVAIEPVKAVEFIYIPLRLKNTGTIHNIASQ